MKKLDCPLSILTRAFEYLMQVVKHKLNLVSVVRMIRCTCCEDWRLTTELTCYDYESYLSGKVTLREKELLSILLLDSYCTVHSSFFSI